MSFDITKDLKKGDRIRRIQPSPNDYKVGKIYTFLRYRDNTDDLYVEEVHCSGLCDKFELVEECPIDVDKYKLDDSLFEI